MLETVERISSAAAILETQTCFSDAAELKITLREYVRKEPVAHQERCQLMGRWMGGDQRSMVGLGRSATWCSQLAGKQGFQKIAALLCSALRHK